jgi:site-specific recombinase XerD
MSSVKLEPRKRANGRKRIYLVVNIEGNRKYTALDLWIEPETRANKQKNKETKELAENVRKDTELKLVRNEYNFEVGKQKKSFTEYFKRLAIKKNRKYNDNWRSAVKHFEKYAGDVKFHHIDRSFCEKFLNYLPTQHLKPISANNLFCKLISTLHLAVQEGIIIRNPASGLKLKEEESEREFLTVEEVKLMHDTPIHPKHEGLRRAFLFSCFTGLRLVDIEKLDYSQIKDGKLKYRQSKTGSFEYLKISKQAHEYIDRTKTAGSVFNLGSRTTLKYWLQFWANAAGLKKHLTYHMARHTAATMMLSSGIDIYTCSKLLGHKNVRTTQIYARILDKQKEEAVDKLPTF